MSFQNNPLHSCEYSFSHNVRNNLVSSFNSRVTHFKSWDISCMNIIEKLRTFFLTPKYTFGTKNAQKACSGAPSNWVLFQKIRWKYTGCFFNAPPPKITKCRPVSKFFRKKLKYPDCPPLKSLSVGLPPPLPLKFLSVKSLLTGADT